MKIWDGLFLRHGVVLWVILRLQVQRTVSVKVGERELEKVEPLVFLENFEIVA